MKKYEFKLKNGYSLFSDDLENDELVFFHGTFEKNFKPICQYGFKSANELTGEGLSSVCYYNKSNSSLHYVISERQDGDNMVVFAVRFKKEDLSRIAVKDEEIHVFIPEIQPIMIGYCVVPADYVHK